LNARTHVASLSRNAPSSSRRPDAELAHRHREREMRRIRRLRKRFERAASTQPGEKRVGDERAVLLPHRRMPAKEAVQQQVGGLVQRAEFGDRRREDRDAVRPRRHCSGVASSTRIESSRASSVPRFVAVTRILTGM
jgi:hypothetical protein